MRRSLCLFVLLVASIPLVDHALACSCAPPPPPKKSLEQSVAVFSGKCIDVVVKNNQKVVTFEVDRVWKGEIGPNVVITTAENGAACGYGFTTKGDAIYLIYAYGKKGELSTNICTRTNSLGNAKEDLKELGDGEKPKEEKKKE